MALTVPVEDIYRIARRRVWDPVLAEDVAQTACLYALAHRPAYPIQYVLDAIDHELRRGAARAERLPWPIEHPEWIASHYPTDAALVERWVDEANEDLAAEWAALPVAERERRELEAEIGLQSSPGPMRRGPLSRRRLEF